MGHKAVKCARNSLNYIAKWKICARVPLSIRLLYLIFCVVVLAECFLNGRSMRTGQKRSVNMITPTEILTKRTRELFQDWSWSEWYERQRISSSLSILHQWDAYQKWATIWSEWNISNSWEKNLLQCDSGWLWYNKKVYLERNISCYRIIQGRLHCGHRFVAEFCAVKKGPFKTMPIQHRINCSAFRRSPLKLSVDELLSKWLRLEKLSSQSDCRDLYSIDDTINEHYPNW